MVVAVWLIALCQVFSAVYTVYTHFISRRHLEHSLEISRQNSLSMKSEADHWRTEHDVVARQRDEWRHRAESLLSSLRGKK